MSNILVIGATSAIAEATARQFAAPGTNFFLAARDMSRLEVISKDLKTRGAKEVFIASFDAENFESHPHLIDTAFERLQNVNTTLIAHGTLPNQKSCEKNTSETIKQININALSTVSLLTSLANKYEQQASGVIAVITSVAGDRGRQSNYVYGASKSMVSTFLQGLRNRLSKSKVTILDIKPGFVDTPMTVNFSKGALWSTPEGVAKDIQRAITKKRSHLYTPFFWKYIMRIIKLIPERIFIKLKL